MWLCDYGGNSLQCFMFLSNVLYNIFEHKQEEDFSEIEPLPWGTLVFEIHIMVVNLNTNPN